MKKYLLILVTISFFLIVNTNYYWEGKVGIATIPIFIALVAIFFILLIILIVQFVKGLNENFHNRNRIWTIVILLLSLILIFIKPYGWIDFDRLEGDDVLIAQREGAVNCMTTLKIKSNNIFREKDVCFGVSVTTGKYKIKNDTIYFLDVSIPKHKKDFYEYAIIKKSKFSDEDAIFRYKNKNDSLGQELWIVKNKLKK